MKFEKFHISIDYELKEDEVSNPAASLVAVASPAPPAQVFFIDHDIITDLQNNNLSI